MNTNFFIVIGLIIFIFYISKSNDVVESFANKNDYSVLFNKFFKNNKDLDFKKIKDLSNPKNIAKLQHILSNQVAPIVQNVQKQNANVSALNSKITSRIPGKGSDFKNYKIPMPSFGDLHGDKFRPKPNKNLKKNIKYQKIIDMDNTEKNKRIRNRKKVRKGPSVKKIFNDKISEEEEKNFRKVVKKNIKENFQKKIQKRTITNQKVCKFVTSTSKNKLCPKDYPIFTGASLSSVGGNLSCNGVNVPQNPANAVAVINEGKVEDIKVIHSGSNYTKPPKIMIKGDGKDATAVAKINSGKVYKIVVTNKGSGYNATPYILIQKPKKKVFCNLCCKSEL